MVASRTSAAACLLVGCSGAAWRQRAASAPWAARNGMSTAVVNGSTLCLMGGSGEEWLGDVWCSQDLGASWAEEAAFPGGVRVNGRMEVVGEEVLVLAGSTHPADTNDVWASRDMKTWALRTRGAPFLGRGSLASAALGDKVFVIGGINYGNATWTHFNDVWMSGDGGRTWEVSEHGSSWHPRGGHSVVALESGKMVLTGGAFFAGEGHDEQLFSDAWMSDDNGRSWQLMTDQAPWGARGYHKTQAIGDRIVLLGGFTGSYENDVWESRDFGASWTQVDTQHVWSNRENFGFEVVQTSPPSLVVFGGADDNGKFNDVWSMPVEEHAIV